MKNLFLIAMMLWGVFVSRAVAQSAEEARLIQVLESNTAAVEKEDVCRRLKQIGTTRCVSAVAKLLTDEQLYQSACDVLETLPDDKANKALLGALTKARGKSQVAIIHTLGELRYQPATAEMARLLDHSDLLLTTSAARALGRMGSPDAVEYLRRKLPVVTGSLRDAMVDALLDCAGQLLRSGDRAAAQAIYTQFNDTKEKEQVHAAAYAGLIRTADAGRALELVLAGLTNDDAATQGVALRLAVTIQASKATAAITNLLTKASPPLQIALLHLLQQRGDVSAAPAVFTQAQNPDATVRMAALAALGKLGDATAVALLADVATSRDEAEQRTARLALTELRCGNVAETMIAQLPTANPGVQVELIRALTARMDRTSAPKLLELASTGTPAAQRSALRGLEQLADASHLPALVKLLEAAKDESSRTDIQSVFEALVDRTPPGEKVNVSAIVQGLNTTNVTTRVALLQVGAFFADTKLRDAFRVALTNANPHVRSAAERAVCNSRDAKLIPELLELAKSSPEVNLRALALEGYVRLLRESVETIPLEQRIEWLAVAYERALRPEERRMVLSALPTATSPESLQIATKAWHEPAIRAEAEVSIAKVARELLLSGDAAAVASLRRLVEYGSTATVRTDAAMWLKEFDSGWLVSGPYRQPGKECRELFDVPFPPEQKNSEPGIAWVRARGTTNLVRWSEVDLAGLVKGEHCVAYLKTQVFVPATQTVVFFLGADDGIKLWVNGELIHTNNVQRPLTPGEDRANGKLQEGWNEVLAKITQATAGCGMTMEIKARDGTAVSGLRIDAHKQAP